MWFAFIEYRSKIMEKLVDLIINPWPWFVSGPLLGLIVPLLLIVGNKEFGVSSVFRHIFAMTGIIKNEYFKYDWHKEKWNLLVVLGVFMAGVVFSLSSIQSGELSNSAIDYFTRKQISIKGYFPNGLYNWVFNFRLGLLLVGGVLLGFGSRYANGCTSGHAIMGLSKLNLGSLIAVVGFFIGGVIGVWLIIDNIL